MTLRSRLILAVLTFVLVVPTLVTARSNEQQQNPNDVMVYRNTPLNVVPFGNRNPISEPSVAKSPDGGVLQVGNHFAAISLDSGNTFEYVDIYPDLPSTARSAADADALYVPSYDLFVWIRLHSGSVIRISVFKGKTGLAQRSWQSWDFIPDMIGLPTYGFDFPKVAATTSHLHLTAVLIGGGQTRTSTILRLPLSELATRTSGSNLTLSWHTPPEALPTYGIGNAVCAVVCSTAYFGQPFESNGLRIWRWNDADPSPTTTLVTISSFPNQYATRGTFQLRGTCPSPDGNDSCSANAPQIFGWVATDTIGFSWVTGVNEEVQFPYIHVARLNRTTLTVIDEPVIRNTGHALRYHGIAANQRGHLAVSASFMGGGFHPSSALFVLDDMSPTWTRLDLLIGRGTPGIDRWGDYLIVRPEGNTWIGTTYVLQGACETQDPCVNVDIRFLWFGRPRDNPLPPTPTPIPTSTPTPTPIPRQFLPLAPLRGST